MAVLQQLEHLQKLLRRVTGHLSWTHRHTAPDYERCCLSWGGLSALAAQFGACKCVARPKWHRHECTFHCCAISLLSTHVAVWSNHAIRLSWDMHSTPETQSRVSQDPQVAYAKCYPLSFLAGLVAAVNIEWSAKQDQPKAILFGAPQQLSDKPLAVATRMGVQGLACHQTHRLCCLCI